MKKSRLQSEAWLLPVVLVLLLRCAYSADAQVMGTDGFFKSGFGDAGARTAMTETTGTITNDSFGAPLGSGLFIMAAAAAGYLLLKMKTGNSRAILCLMIVVAALLGFMRCKKDSVGINVVDNQDVVINLRVDGNSKIDVNTSTGAVSFSDGDEIVVANGGVFLGILTYYNGVFSGAINVPRSDDYLHFYHLGNVDVGSLVRGTSDGFTFTITNQSNALPVISYAHTKNMYSGETDYSVKLENKCALVKFDVSSSSQAGVVIKGMNNQVTIDFTEGSFSYGMDGEGEILMSPGNGEKWLILLPQAALDAGAEGSAYAGSFVGERGAVPEVNADDYLNMGIPVSVTARCIPEGGLNGLFTVNAQGKQVRFSQGNLYHDKTDGTWNFYDKQFGRANDNNTIVSSDYSGCDIVEHFCWATSGYAHGAISYNPWSTSSANSDYYAYGNHVKNLYDDTGMADWGYNAITNGGNMEAQWRTLTMTEWNYLLFSRTEASNKYSRGIIEDDSAVYGLIILPDDWTEPYAGCFNPGATPSEAKTYTKEEWAMMEEAGAVFLPHVGRRSGTNITSVFNLGVYWTSSASDANNAQDLFFNISGSLNGRPNNRNWGCCVRLVSD